MSELTMTELNNTDYTKILEYYKKSIPKSKRLLKMSAEKIMSEKLCRCIKKVDKTNEARAIGICTKTIFNKKGYTRGKFKCKGKSTVKFNKTLKNKTLKNKK
jgi:hypothetical protein